MQKAGKNKSRGFTLIELLVVVLILGILAAVALPQYQKAVKKARLAQWDVMYDAGRKAIEAYLLENGFPASGSIKLTGKNRVGTIEMPGNCDIDEYYCYISAGGLYVYCDPNYCHISMDSTYHADGTFGNNALDGAFVLIAISKNRDWVIEGVDAKPACEWVARKSDIPVSGEGVYNCADYGITLPNPVLEE